MSRATMRVAGHRRRKLHQTEAGPQFSRFDQGGSAVRWSAKLLRGRTGTHDVYTKCLFAKARPEPDFR